MNFFSRLPQGPRLYFKVETLQKDSTAQYRQHWWCTNFTRKKDSPLTISSPETKTSYQFCLLHNVGLAHSKRIPLHATTLQKSQSIPFSLGSMHKGRRHFCPLQVSRFGSLPLFDFGCFFFPLVYANNGPMLVCGSFGLIPIDRIVNAYSSL